MPESASSFSGCVQRFKSKCCIALPTDAEIVRVFEKTSKLSKWMRTINMDRL